MSCDHGVQNGLSTGVNLSNMGQSNKGQPRNKGLAAQTIQQGGRDS